MSRRQFSVPLSAVICRQFPNLSIWLRTSWTNPSPSSVAHATSQRRFLTTFMSPLSVDFGMFIRTIFIYLRGSFRTFRHYLIRYTSSCSWWHWCSVPSWLIPAASASVKELIWWILCTEVPIWSTPVKGYLYFLFVGIRMVHWVWRFSGAAVLSYCQTDTMVFIFIYSDFCSDRVKSLCELIRQRNS